MLTTEFFVFVKYPISWIHFVELKLPFKVKIKYLNEHENSFQGKVVFHEKEYSIIIRPQENEKIIKVSFPVMGVTDNQILVRVSGPSGVYVQDHVKFKGKGKFIEIFSDIIFYEIVNNQKKLDTLEIFVK